MEISDEDIIAAIREESLKDMLRAEEGKIKQREQRNRWIILILVFILVIGFVIYSKTNKSMQEEIIDIDTVQYDEFDRDTCIKDFRVEEIQ